MKEAEYFDVVCIGLGPAGMAISIMAAEIGLKVCAIEKDKEGSGEMINEWALIIQQKIRLHSVMFLAHSFPTMGFLSKRVAEIWMMDKMESSNLRKFIRIFYKKV